MADGFKIAEAYVDIDARMDGRRIKRVIEQALNEAGLKDAGKAAGEKIAEGVDEAVGAKMKETGKKTSDTFGKSGEDSRHGFARGFMPIVGMVGEIGGTAIKLFSDVFNFRTPALTIGVLAAAMAALPIVAAAAAVAIVGAFGGAFTTIGIIAAVQNEEVKRAFASAWADIKLLAANVAAPFVSSMVKVADEWERTFAAFAPHLQKMFIAVQPHLDGFTSNFGLAMRRLIPAMGPLTEAFNILLDRLGGRLPGLFSTLADMVTRLSNALIENPALVDAVVNSIEFLINAFTTIVEVGANAAHWIQENSQRAKDLFMAVSAVINPLATFALNLAGVNDEATPVERSVALMKDQVQRAVDAVNEANTATQEWTLSLDQLAARNLTTEQAALRFDQSVLKLKDSIDKNGTSLDTTTDKGAKNKDALLGMAEAANRAKDTFIEQGLSQDEVNIKSVQMRDAMIKTAQELGFTRDQAAELIDKYFVIPEKVETQVNAPGAVVAKEQADRVKGSVDKIPRDTTINLNVSDNASGALSNVIGLIGSIARQIWVNVTAIFSNDGNVVSFANGSERHVAQIAGAGAMRIWAEPETGGEAYIPLAPNKRDRSEAILADVADRFGLTVGRRMADGGILDSVGMVNPGTGKTVQISSLNVSVNLAGVWDFTDPAQARRIADKIAPAIREAIRVDERRYL